MRAGFDIAGQTFELALPDVPALTQLPRAWRSFATDASAKVLVKVTLNAEAPRPEGWLPVLPQVERRDDGSWELRGDGYRGRVAPGGALLEVEQPPERFPLEACIRVVLAERLAGARGLLVHGAGVELTGRAALFTGPSGAGKSTLFRCCAQAGLGLLSDELVAVLPDASGYVAQGTPWNQGTPARARLALLGTLSHASDDALEPQEPAELLRCLLSNVVVPEETAAARARAFRLASALVNRIPAVRLRFAPTLACANPLRRALSPT